MAGILLITALLVDRFVLLDAFESGKGSTGAAWASWLGVNLAPALVWLLLNRRDSDTTRGQLLAGTLAVAAVTAILIVPVLIWYTAADGSLG